MATEIFHGAPGSYKSSTVMWFRLLDALRSGRVVISNLQGLKTIEVIQFELGEIFPTTARIYRISIGHENGLMLIRNFYQWMPIGAFIFIDEVQDVYPNDKTFKAEDYNNKGEGFFDKFLPVELVEFYHKEQRQIKNNVDCHIGRFTKYTGLVEVTNKSSLNCSGLLNCKQLQHSNYTSLDY